MHETFNTEYITSKLVAEGKAVVWLVVAQVLGGYAGIEVGFFLDFQTGLARP